MENEPPLGRKTDYPERYSPELLYPISRRESRELLGIGDPLPFAGVDIWNAWELTWLGPGGKPEVGSAEIRVPADSPNLVESKSLKLYLNSLAMCRYADARELSATLSADLGRAAGAGVDVRVAAALDTEGGTTAILPGDCIDSLAVDCERWEVCPDYLQSAGGAPADYALHSHLLRSLCPVTGQPDTASLSLAWRGPDVDRAGLLRYIVSFRQHQDFHEACVERIFDDFRRRCEPELLTVYARYQRRGGIDINPFRSNAGTTAENTRLWRQ